MFGELDTREPVVLEPPEYMQDEWGREKPSLDFNVDGASARLRFREFFRNFKQDNIFIYRDALLRNWNRRELYIEVDLSHLNEFDEVLFNNLQAKPNETLPLFESGAKDALKMSLTAENQEVLKQSNVPDFQIILKSNQNTHSLRDLTAEHVNSLIKVPGIVISCSKARSKAVEVVIRCTKCRNTKSLSCKAAMGGVQIPSKCDRGGAPGEDCGPNPYVIMADQCEYIDQQTLKLQESPEVVPTGEMPRNIMLTVDRYLVDRVVPGTRVSVIGVVSLFNSAGQKKGVGSATIRTPFLRVLGMQIDTDGSGRSSGHFTPQEEDEFKRMSRDPLIYEKLANSIAPQISGDYTKDIKKAIACLLMGGSRKVLPDGVRLRGDINVLLMGDPSTAKSQFLKFVEKVAPIGVYTSGKGSSAAGLTASVIKDSKGEFFLEGGAMVLADGGVICIDEFDKMRETDRVAIHEAMEQQTISIAKAGITTMLNCRNSVLAAANPIHGRYDDLRDVGENINLMSTILSRFDCIFIIRDIRNEERDKNIAKHVLGVHVNSSLHSSTLNANGTGLSQNTGYLNSGSNNHSVSAVTQGSTSNGTSSFFGSSSGLPGDNNGGEIPAHILKKYICYCRERCAPRLNDEAAALLSGQYVHIRNQVRESLLNKANRYQSLSKGAQHQQQQRDAQQVVPITIRQLEAIIRLSEALAKMRLSPEATVKDVEEGLRLFRISTLAASQSNPLLMSMIHGQNNMSKDLQVAEEYIRGRIGRHVSVSTKKIVEEAQLQGYSLDIIKTAIRAMVMRDEMQELKQGAILRRK